MNELKLAIRNQQTAFRPGEEITGAAGWQLDKTPETAELKLFWRTEGKGGEDVDVVQSINLDHPQQEEARPFKLTAPNSPYSFSGKLISIIWGLELVIQPGAHSSHVDLIIGPDGKEVAFPGTTQETPKDASG